MDPVLAAISSIISAFEENRVYLADAALRLKQSVAYELFCFVRVVICSPALSKQRKECEKVIDHLSSQIGVYGTYCV